LWTTSRRVGWLGLALNALALAAAAGAAPLNLNDPSPRWVSVRFEVSPADEPGSLNERWSAARSAYIAPDPEARVVRIYIPGREIEAQLGSVGMEIVPGSFSEFIWTLDPHSGHVLKAEMTGHVRERISLGWIHASTLVEIRVEMTTREAGGFEPSRSLLGLETNGFCSPRDESSGCIAVAPARFDPASGYVNAVGSVQAATAIARILAFSPLGEVQFSERAEEGTEVRAVGTSQQDAICSDPFKDGPCGADLGGES
jgi:hypothetical protein